MVVCTLDYFHAFDWLNNIVCWCQWFLFQHVSISTLDMWVILCGSFTIPSIYSIYGGVFLVVGSVGPEPEIRPILPEPEFA